MPQTKNIEITPGKGEPVVINVSQGDIGREITLNLKDGSGWFDLTGCTVKIEGVKPSGLGFSVSGQVSGHTATITTNEQMTSEYGHIACELTITKTGIKLGTANMILAVERDPHPEGTTDGTVETLIPELTVLVERIESDAAQIEAEMATLKTAAETAASNAASSAEAASDSAGAASAAAEEVEELIHDLTTPIWFDDEGYLCF